MGQPHFGELGSNLGRTRPLCFGPLGPPWHEVGEQSESSCQARAVEHGMRGLLLPSESPSQRCGGRVQCGSPNSTPSTLRNLRTFGSAVDTPGRHPCSEVCVSLPSGKATTKGSHVCRGSTCITCTTHHIIRITSIIRKGQPGCVEKFVAQMAACLVPAHRPVKPAAAPQLSFLSTGTGYAGLMAFTTPPQKKKKGPLNNTHNTTHARTKTKNGWLRTTRPKRNQKFPAPQCPRAPPAAFRSGCGRGPRCGCRSERAGVGSLQGVGGQWHAT